MKMKKLFRDIHLWLSVPFGVFITLICFSGSMLVFEKEISEWCRPGLYFVDEVKEQPLPLDELMEQVAATLPDSVAPTGITIFPEADRAWQVSLSKPRRASVYVDPYTGQVKGYNSRLPFFDTMFHLHRWLLGPSSGVGKWLVGVSTLLLVVILLTGLLMWLTNRHKPLLRSLTLSFTKGWPRFWHDLHVAGGIYATLFLLALALTGLTWSFSWYRNGFYSLFGVESSAHEVGPAAGGHVRGRQGGRPEGRERRGASGSHRRSPYAHWQEVYETVAAAHPGYRQLTVTDAVASVVPAGRTSLRATDSYDFHPRSGEITGSRPYDTQDKAAKVRSAVYMVHVGSWGGLLTRVLTFLSALLGATLPLTGYYLWLRRWLRKRRHLRQEPDRFRAGQA